MGRGWLCAFFLDGDFSLQKNHKRVIKMRKNRENRVRKSAKPVIPFVMLESKLDEAECVALKTVLSPKQRDAENVFAITNI